MKLIEDFEADSNDPAAGKQTLPVKSTLNNDYRNFSKNLKKIVKMPTRLESVSEVIKLMNQHTDGRSK